VTDSVVLRGVRVVEPGVGVGPPTSLCLVGGRVVSEGEAAATCPAQSVVLDGLWLAPGLIDLQVNGAAGRDTTEDPGSIWAVGEAIAATGVTAFLPTVITAPAGRIEDALAVLEGGPPAGYRGATPLGLHLEGPFLSPDRYGAHDPAFLRWPDPTIAAGWSRAAGVAIVTLAPDLPGSLELIRMLVAKGVVVSLGHSSATLEEARAGIDAGARYATHLFNAMPPMAHREPGIAAAVLTDERVTVGTIPDTIHVHPAMLDIAWRIVGSERFSIVTDAMAALGMPHGSFRLADREVTVDETGPRLPDGLLAGSILRLDAGVRNLAAATGRGFETAIAAATTVPARLLGLEDRGRITPGARADFTIVTPEFEAVGTIVGGELVWAAPQLSEVPVWA
jgi:N-acetylglucosamine-6-phosphate deacetylase